MKTGLIHAAFRRQTINYKLRRQVVAEFRSELEQATGWRRQWLRWKRGITLQIRYNELLFSTQTSLRSSLVSVR